MDCALGSPGDSGKNGLLALSGVPWDDPPWFTFSVSLSLAQSHMSLGTEGLRSQGGIVLVAPHKHHLCLSPQPQLQISSRVLGPNEEWQKWLYPTVQVLGSE